MCQLAKSLQKRPQGALPNNTVPNPMEDVKVITIRSGINLAGPSVPPNPLFYSKEVERDLKPTMDQVHISSSESTRSSLKSYLKKLRDPGKFLIHCNFSELEECMALADQGANINLMPLYVWKKLMLPKLVPTRMTLKLANRLVAYPAGIAEDVFVQVGKFTFLADFVVVDYDDHFHEVSKVQKSIHLLSGIPTVLPFGSSDPLSGSTTSLFDHSLPDYEAFCFDVDHQKVKSSGSTTSHFDHSLLNYKAFCFDVDHRKENNNLLYYDPLINPPPIAERSDSHHEEFANELAHIISPPEYDHFYFDIEDDLREFTRLLNENLSSESVNLNKIMEDNESKFQALTKLPTSHELNILRLLISSTDSTLSMSFSKTGHLVSFPFGNEDKVFDPATHYQCNSLFREKIFTSA
uniref:Reverse transcriptase domain-containing protein n=1 Tax=Tanacetum cinerariifolium TaxID=118510 RepID=A0A6L2N962_TANCI|nr:reverse transcriptase domain-containing protein [Tanacetum cinerariifolium]